MYELNHSDFTNVDISDVMNNLEMFSDLGDHFTTLWTRVSLAVVNSLNVKSQITRLGEPLITLRTR